MLLFKDTDVDFLDELQDIGMATVEALPGTEMIWAIHVLQGLALQRGLDIGVHVRCLDAGEIEFLVYEKGRAIEP